MTNVSSTPTPKKFLATERKAKPAAGKYGFGLHFTDHIFVAKYQSDKGWYESAIKPFADFQLSPAASVLHYGQAMFEGMKAFRQTDGKIVLFRPEFNAERMIEGSKRLCMQAPPVDLFVNAVKEVVRVDESWVPSEPGTSLYIRPTLIGTEGFLGVRPSKEYIFFIILSPAGSYYGSQNPTVKIWVEQEMVRATPGGLGSTKAAANYAASLFAAEQAKKHGFAQVMWLDHEHTLVEEVGTMNVMFVIDGQIVTPSLGGTILRGGTRDSCLRLAKSWDMKVQERAVTWDELKAASQNGKLTEAFGTGTAAVITPISELVSSDSTIKLSNNGVGPISQKLYTALTDIQYGKAQDPWGWIVPV